MATIYICDTRRLDEDTQEIYTIAAEMRAERKRKRQATPCSPRETMRRSRGRY